MKKIIFSLCLLFCMNILTFAENTCANPTQNPKVRYRLFPTGNMWTFLKLDTVTGKIWQVQFSTKGEDYRFETVLNSVDIANLQKVEKVVGRFTLYPTENIYNFILVDQNDGFTYQVQWSSEKEDRAVLSIK